VLRGFLSESVLFHLVYWMSSFLSCLVCVCVSEQTKQKSLRRSSSWLPHEADTESDKAKSEEGTSDSEGSESASDSEQNDPPSSLASDAEQYELMQASYVAVGRDFHDQEDLIGSEYSKLQRLELVPERWPLLLLAKMR